MTVKAHTEWTMEELWRQEQGNFTAHMAIVFHYLEKHGLPLDDFIRFVGESVLPAWPRRGDSVPDVMTRILLNVRANGATVQDVHITETHAEATVSSPLRPDVMERYGIAPEVAGRSLGQVPPHRRRLRHALQPDVPRRRPRPHPDRETVTLSGHHVWRWLGRSHRAEMAHGGVGAVRLFG